MAPPTRRMALGGVVSALVVAAGAAASAAAGPAVHRQANGVIVVDSRRLRVRYDGRLISQAELSRLNHHHKAMFSAGDVPSAERGYGHAFDTMGELDAYSRQLLGRGRPPVARRTRNPGTTSGG